jgi:uroporphyrinogen decarboxylase
VPFQEFFGIDHVAEIRVDNSPRFPQRVIEETDDYVVHTSEFGVTMKDWKSSTSTPQFLDHTIKDADSWRSAKGRMLPSRDRIDWKNLSDNYAGWRTRGSWIEAVLWFGFDISHAWVSGTERVLIALIEDPEWVMDMISTMLDLNLALLDMVWDEGYRYDSVIWFDDMGYKGHQFFSMAMYREFLKPFHQRAIDWAHAKGIKAHLHSCGNVSPFVAELVEMGLDTLNPLEVKAGMDPIQIKQEFGTQLVLHGGMNAVFFDQPEKIEAEIQSKLPILKKDGGYIFSSDHTVPDSVSLEGYRQIVGWAKRYGAYG